MGYASLEVPFDWEFAQTIGKYVTVIYLAWAFVYYSIIFFIRWNYIEKNGLMTLYHYAIKIKQTPGGVLCLQKFQPKYRWLVSMFDHLVFVIITLPFALLAFFYQYFAIGFLAFIAMIAIWNAATYYIEQFPRSYMNQFAKKEI